MWNRRHHYCASALVLLTACSEKSPTAPTPSETPPIAVSITLANPGTLSLSQPIACSTDRDSRACPNGLQPQGPAAASTVRTEHYTLRPGTYLLTGRVQGTTSLSPASVRIAFGRGTSGPGGGVDNTWGGSIFIGPSGPSPTVPPSIIEASCATTFTNDAGVIEWGVIFRVVAATASEQLCR